MTGGSLAEELTNMARNFQPACVLIAAAELDIFTILEKGPLTADAVAARIGGDLRGTATLLDALSALSFLVKKDGAYSAAPGFPDVLSENAKTSILGTVRHQGNCLRRWGRLAEVVKTGRAALDEVSIRGEEGDTESFIRAMHEISGRFLPSLMDSLGSLKFEHLLDIGGASGTWTLQFLRANPQARATIFDLPEVIPMAESKAEANGMKNRIRAVPGDFYTDDLPGGADLAWVSAIVHQNSREQNRALLAKVFRALVPGGIILIRDVIMEESRTAPVMGALFAVNMLVGTERGGTFTFSEMAEDLEFAGFSERKYLHRGQVMDTVISAVKPG
jgi:predicted O-methyltransferase YrrM